MQKHVEVERTAKALDQVTAPVLTVMSSIRQFGGYLAHTLWGINYRYTPQGMH